MLVNLHAEDHDWAGKAACFLAGGLSFNVFMLYFESHEAAVGCG